MDLKLSRMILSRVGRFCARTLVDADAYRKRFIPEALVGITRAGTLVGAGIARGMQRPGEQTEAPWKRLRRQLNSTLWDKREEAMNERFAQEQARWVDERTPILVDLSDLSKKYAREMDDLDWVRDADESARRGEAVIKRGYWIFESYAFGWDEKTPIPLVDFSYSLQEGRFLSENAALREGFEAIHRATGGKGVVVMDRRADADFVLETLEGLEMALTVRLRGDRHLRDEDGRPLGEVFGMAREMTLEGQTTLERRARGRKLRVQIQYGWKKVQVPGLKRPYWLVAAHGCFEHVDRRETDGWWYLLTTEPIRTPQDAQRVLKWYRLRWKAEEAIEFIKSALGLEKVRMLRGRRIRRLITLAFWVMALLAEISADLSEGTRRKLYRLGQVLRIVAADFLLYRFRRAIAVFFDDPSKRMKVNALVQHL